MKKFKKKLRLIKCTESSPGKTKVWYEIHKNWVCGFIPSKFHLIKYDFGEYGIESETYYNEKEAIKNYKRCLKSYNITPPEQDIKTEIVKENTKD